MQIKNILLTTDLSPDAQRAFVPTAKLARSLGAKVTLINAIYVLAESVHDASFGAPLPLNSYERERTVAEESLETQAALLPTDLDVSTKVIAGVKIATTIVHAAEEHKADMIAMSTHGRTGIRRFVMGSVAEEVLRHSPVPVLCFPEPGESDKEQEFKHIVLTTDLSEEALRAFQPVLELAETIGCKITVLHVVPELLAIPHGAPFAPALAQPNISQQVASAHDLLKEQCATLGDKVQMDMQVISHLNPAQGVVEFARSAHADLIALSTHGRSGFQRLILGSVAGEILRKSTVPVLSFHRVQA